jgi:hypothetical protein
MRIRLWAALAFLLRCRMQTAAAQEAPAQPGPSLQAEAAPEEARRLTGVEERLDEIELQMLQVQAETESGVTDDELRPIQFQGKSRSLQMLNPELSAGIEMFGAAVFQDGEFYEEGGLLGTDDHEHGGPMRSGFFLREAAFHVQSTLDPFSMVKLAFALEGGQAHLEEAYVVYSSILPRVGLTLGKFRQTFGAVNRWHRHALDQFDFPVVLKELFGGEGLAQTGLSVDWLMPAMWAHAQEMTLQVTNSQNDHFLAGESFSLPSGLLKLKNYWDLNRNTYLELGFTGLAGFNNRAAFTGTDDAGETVVLADEAVRTSWAAGADLTLNWDPVHRAKYRGFVWRTEFIYARKDTLDDLLDFWGGYSYVENQFSASVSAGVRGDLVRGFRSVDGSADHFSYQVSPYVTWWQSEFVRLRLQYDGVADYAEPFEHRVILQLEAAAGPHKHERY